MRNCWPWAGVAALFLVSWLGVNAVGADAPRNVSVEPATVDFGELPQGRIVRQKVKLRNTNAAAVRIVKAQTSCACLKVAAFPAEIPANGVADAELLIETLTLTGKAEKQWPEEWDRTIDLNLNALFHCSLLAAASMRRRGGGRIINISSIFGHLGSSLFRVSAYAASKGGVENLTRQLAVEWAPDAITVNAIAPAWFPSEMTAGSLEKDSIAERMGSGAPMRRMGKQGELMTACLFLAAPASSYVTGIIVPVDGGYSAW